MRGHELQVLKPCLPHKRGQGREVDDHAVERLLFRDLSFGVYENPGDVCLRLRVDQQHPIARERQPRRTGIQLDGPGTAQDTAQ